jgi:hypothetical protein
MLKWLLSPSAATYADALDIDRMDDSLTREVGAILGRAGVTTFHRTLPRIRDELERARRYQRPLTVALVGDARAVTPATLLDLGSRRRTAPLDPGSPLIPVLLAPVLSEITRTIDVVTYASTLAQCVIVMPEASHDHAAGALRRMAEICSGRLHVPVTVRMATFPEDGLTLEELLRKAAASLDSAMMPLPHPASIPISDGAKA